MFNILWKEFPVQALYKCVLPQEVSMVEDIALSSQAVTLQTDYVF